MFNQTSTISFKPESTGIATCRAYNMMGLGEAKAHVIVNDLNQDLIIWSDNEIPISIGDDVTVTCGASAHKYANELNWYKDDEQIQSGNGE